LADSCDALNGRGGRTSYAVTALPADGSVDGSVRRIERVYDDQGRLARVTSYDSPTGGTAVNEVRYDYDAWGDLTAIWQAHDGNVTASSPKVGYAYETSASGQSMSYVRRAGVTLPSGRSLSYDYTGSVNTALSRLAGVKDAATQGTLAAFSYLGASTIVTGRFRTSHRWALHNRPVM
jgi:YD repeat-containing protein